MAWSVFDLTASIIQIATVAGSTTGTLRSSQIRTVFQLASQYIIVLAKFGITTRISYRAIASRGISYGSLQHWKWGVRSWGKSYNKVIIYYLVRVKIRNFISRSVASKSDGKHYCWELDAGHWWTHTSWLIEYALRRLIPALRGNLFRKFSHTFPPAAVYFRCIIRK